MKQRACAMIGPRPFQLPYGFEEDHPDCVRLKLMLGLEIETLIATGCTEFLCGLSWGVDIWCAEMVLNMARAFPEMPIRLKAVIPCEDHHAGWTEEYQERFFYVLEHACETVVLFPRYADGCYRAQGRYMVDRSASMIAVMNGSCDETADTVEYARRKGLEIVLFHPARLTREHVPGRYGLRLVR
jgi:uncharacterized phage-like protein YoqJ